MSGLTDLRGVWAVKKKKNFFRYFSLKLVANKWLRQFQCFPHLPADAREFGTPLMTTPSVSNKTTRKEGPMAALERV